MISITISTVASWYEWFFQLQFLEWLTYNSIRSSYGCTSTTHLIFNNSNVLEALEFKFRVNSWMISLRQLVVGATICCVHHSHLHHMGSTNDSPLSRSILQVQVKRHLGEDPEDIQLDPAWNRHSNLTLRVPNCHCESDHVRSTPFIPILGRRRTLLARHSHIPPLKHTPITRFDIPVHPQDPAAGLTLPAFVLDPASSEQYQYPQPA